MPPSRTKRVPAAQHSELTEYASLLRALRTNHTLDLAAHLSQHPPNSSQFGDPDHSSDSDFSDVHNVHFPVASTSVASPPRTSDADSPRLGIRSVKSGESLRRVSSVEAEAPGGPSQVKKRKRVQAAHDTWTRWPLLAGDVNRPEWDLADEVQHVADHVRRQHHTARRATPIHSNIDTTLNDYSSSAVSEDDDMDSYSELETDETPMLTLAQASAKRALAASSAAHLRILLALCAAHVPRVEPSLRGRLAPLSWTSVLSIAGAGKVASADVIARIRSRMEAIYGGGISISGNPSMAAPLPHPDASRTHSSQLPQNLPSPIPEFATTTSSAARDRLRMLISQREEEGDGDVFAFRGPQPRIDPDITGKIKPRRIRKRKEERPVKGEDEEGQALAENKP